MTQPQHPTLQFTRVVDACVTASSRTGRLLTLTNAQVQVGAGWEPRFGVTERVDGRTVSLAEGMSQDDVEAFLAGL